MAKGYVVFTADVKDQDALNAYGMKAAGTIFSHGGSVLVVADGAEVIEGRWPSRTVVLEFESVEKAREWYNSPEYQAVVGERLAAVTDGNAAIVPGFEMPG
jgi:uncharacterized protein (DUF1330 family)